jgi:AcrR family transcriptional regulator
MSNRVNRKEDILKAAGPLFVQQGYDGTSVQQIADEVGCTKAALYYHFKDGKKEILQQMMEAHRPDMTYLLEPCTEATSLRELLLCWAKGVADQGPEMMARFRWISSEYPKLDQDQQEMVQQVQAKCIKKFSYLIEPFVENRREAERMAMLVFSGTVGYLMVSLGFGLDSAFNNSAEEYMEMLADTIVAER